MRHRKKVLGMLAGAVLLALFWRELPAIKRYIKIERM